ncbi:MAG: glutamate racemase [Acidobacteria bacterium 13_1_20CM_3_53_8]|nr:MAG: glutamate racemase [Acidobacteria bacterium 13_1_20CM_3_53_8]
MFLNSNLPIGIFDSGVGGLTVYRALHERLPDERFVYLGDTARVPYGTKSLATVERYAIENARFLALALPAIRRAVNLEVIGVIEPGARTAVEVSSEKRIGVIATEATVQSGAYREAISDLVNEVTIIERACPLFVALAEEGWAETEVAREVASEYLSEMKDSSIDTLVLGCTHYPILRGVIQEVVGPNVRLIDSGEATARDCELLLQTKSRAHEPVLEIARERRLCDDLDHFYVTDAAERFSRVAERFLGSAPSRLEAVEVWGHDELRAY